MPQLLFVVFFFLIPQTLFAAVMINEVAWMGSQQSANDEWIELYNDGSNTVALDEWVLTDGMNLEVELAGALGAGQFALLERTDDSSAPGKAFMIYTGALPNTGATLRLLRADGSLEDQVAGGEGWENIGGDNTTKESAQLSPNGWVTGSPTPGRTNTLTDSRSETEADTDDSTEQIVSVNEPQRREPKEQKRILRLPDHELTLTLTAPTRGYVNQPLTFTLEAGGVVDVIENSLTYEWNFGDLSTESGRSVEHSYPFPGTYVVSVWAGFARHEAVLRHEITILPVSFSITRNQEGDIQISNDAPYEIDLSGYSLAGKEQITIPARTILLPNNTITIPRERIENDFESLVALYDNERVVVATHLSQELNALYVNGEATRDEATVAVATVASSPLTPLIPVSAPLATEAATTEFTFAGENRIEPVATSSFGQLTYESPVEPQSVRPGVAAAAAAATPGPAERSSDLLPYLALIALLSVAIIGLYLGRKSNGPRNYSREKVVLFDDHD